MPASATTALLLATALWLPMASTSLHEGIHERIQKVSLRIKEQPDDARLYLARADLYRSHQDWPEAEADLKAARQSGVQVTELQIAEARLYLDRNRPLQAVNQLLAHNSSQANDPQAWQLLAQAWSQLHRYHKSANAMAKAIELYETLEPDHFHFRARTLEKLGPSGIEEALLCVEDGLEKLGACISLELLAVDLQSKLGQYAAAQQRLDRLSEHAKRQESWLIRKGDVFWQGGMRGEARVQYQAAVSAIAQLRPRSRSTRAVQNMLQHAQARLAPTLDANSLGGH